MYLIAGGNANQVFNLDPKTGILTWQDVRLNSKHVRLGWSAPGKFTDPGSWRRPTATRRRSRSASLRINREEFSWLVWVRPTRIGMIKSGFRFPISICRSCRSRLWRGVEWWCASCGNGPLRQHRIRSLKSRHHGRERQNPPRFELDEYKANVYANDSIGTQIVWIQAVDPDAGLKADIAYSIYEKEKKHRFGSVCHSSRVWMNQPEEGGCLSKTRSTRFSSGLKIGEPITNNFEDIYSL